MQLAKMDSPERDWFYFEYQLFNMEAAKQVLYLYITFNCHVPLHHIAIAR